MQTALSIKDKRAHRNHDYLSLFPGNVFPTGDIDILERNEHVLIIKSYEHGRPIVQAHHRIYCLLTRFGAHPDAPGSITVACVWGLGRTTREWKTYDHVNRPSPAQAGDVNAWREWLMGWWKDHR